MKFLSTLDKLVEKISSYALIISVLLMLVMSILIIVLRWFGESFLWIDPFVRHLVFLSAFLGGVIATGRKSHIGIDIVGRYLESKKKHRLCLYIERLVSLACCLTSGWMVLASYDFFKIEAEFGKVAFLGIHSKFLVGIIPLGFSLIAYRFFYQFIFSCCGKKSSNENNDSNGAISC